jgi:hypothetical protein
VKAILEVRRSAPDLCSDLRWQGKSYPKRLLVSLTDGYAFDAKDKTYCKGPPELLEYQRKTTYMQDYAKLINIAKKVSPCVDRISITLSSSLTISGRSNMMNTSLAVVSRDITFLLPMLISRRRTSVVCASRRRIWSILSATTWSWIASIRITLTLWRERERARDSVAGWEGVEVNAILIIYQRRLREVNARINNDPGEQEDRATLRETFT